MHPNLLKKQEHLFKPQANLSYTYGAPDQGDFMRSRINKPMRAANVNPFEEKKVGPGLNNGFSSEGQVDLMQEWKQKILGVLRQ